MESDEAAGSDSDIMGNGYLAFDNGARAFVRSMESGGATWDFDVIGEDGRIRTPNDAQAWELTSMAAETFPPVENRRPGVRARRNPVMHQFPWPTHMQGMGLTIVDDIISSFENGHPPKCSGDDALKALETAIAMRESHRQGFVPRGPASRGPQSEDSVGRDSERRRACADSPADGRGVGLMTPVARRLE